MHRIVTAGVWIIAAFVMANGIALASGSFAAGSSARLLDDYNRGKVIAYKRLTCATCPFASGSVDKELAQNIVAKIDGKDATLANLSDDEQQAVVVYLRKRFELE